MDPFGDDFFSAAVDDMDPATEPVPDAWSGAADALLVLQRGVPHAVVPQLLAPWLAAMIPGYRGVRLRTVSDAVPVVSELRSLSGSELVAVNYARHLPNLRTLHCRAVDAACMIHVLAITAGSNTLSTLSLEFKRVDAAQAVEQLVARPPPLTSLSLDSTSMNTSVLRDIAAHFPRLVCLRINALTIQGGLMQRTPMAPLPELQEFHLCRCSSSPYIQDILEGLAVTSPMLRVVKLDDSTLTRGIPFIRRLEELSLAGCRMPLRTVRPMARTLTSLSLAGRWALDAADLAALSSLTALRVLNLHKAVAVDDRVIATIAELTSMQELDLSDLKTSAALSLTPLLQLTNMQTLKLSRASTIVGREFIEGVASSMKKLRLLQVAVDGTVGMSSIAALHRLPQLEYVFMDGAAVDLAEAQAALPRSRVVVVNSSRPRPVTPEPELAL